MKQLMDETYPIQREVINSGTCVTDIKVCNAVVMLLCLSDEGVYDAVMMSRPHRNLSHSGLNTLDSWYKDHTAVILKLFLFLQL